MKINVAIADDHPLITDGLHHVLTGCPDIEITDSYVNGTELLKGIVVRQPDVLLLDIQMPGKTGDELIDIIKALYPNMKILALTNQDSVYYIKTMLRKGAAGYILKTTRKDILLDAIRTVHRGEQYLETALREKVLQDTLQAKKQVSTNLVLSRREKEILNYISLDMTSEEIAGKIFVSKRTVDFHRLNLLMKFGVKSVGALVKKGIQLGLIE